MISPELIDKSKIIISRHAAERFLERSALAYSNLQKQNLSEEMILDRIGVTVPEDNDAAKRALCVLLRMSDHQKASTKLDRLNEIYRRIRAERMENLSGRPSGEQPACFFRYNHWQFIVVQSREEPGKFILTTVVWINDEKFGQIMG